MNTYRNPDNIAKNRKNTDASWCLERVAIYIRNHMCDCFVTENRLSISVLVKGRCAVDVGSGVAQSQGCELRPGR